jgi:AmmeMemoRadiSam system protein A
MFPLRKDEKRSLLDIARKAVESAMLRHPAPEVPASGGSLAAVHGAFVTLRCRGRLRGCIGRIAPAEALANVVAECAVAAAIDDPRFPRLQPADLREVQIELSVLSCPQSVATGEVQPGIHGLVISQGEKRGVLLPQVAAERRWSRERFLEETCQKAGLEPDAWQNPATHIEIFTAEVFSDADAETLSDDDNSTSADAYSSSQ